MCDAIAQSENVTVRVEPAATTADRLAAANDPADAHADGWLTIAPQTGIVNDAQVRNGRAPVFGADETLARSPLVFAASKERLPTLAEHCAPATAINWACLGDVAGHPWSELGGDEDLGAGHARARRPAGEHCRVVGDRPGSDQQAAAHRLRARRRWTTTSSSPGSWSSRRTSIARGGGPLDEMLRFEAGIDVAQVSKAEACSALRGAAQAKNIGVVVPTPMTTADVVFAPVRNRAGSQCGSRGGHRRRRALGTGRRRVACGWRTAQARGPCAVRSVPVRLTTSSNLPAAGRRWSRSATGSRAVVEAGKAIVRGAMSARSTSCDSRPVDAGAGLMEGYPMKRILAILPVTITLVGEHGAGSSRRADRGERRRLHPGRHGRAAQPVPAHDRPGEAVQRLRPRRGRRRCIRGVVARSRRVPPRRCSKRAGPTRAERTEARGVVAGRELWRVDPEPSSHRQGAAGDGSRGHAGDGQPAGHRDAEGDGRSARLADTAIGYSDILALVN